MGSLRPGYYDVVLRMTQQSCDVDGGPLGPEEPYVETWLGARVLMIDDNGDAIVEHYPVGWVNVLRRIDRVSAACVAAGRVTFTKIEQVPGGV